MAVFVITKNVNKNDWFTNCTVDYEAKLASVNLLPGEIGLLCVVTSFINFGECLNSIICTVLHKIILIHGLSLRYVEACVWCACR